MTLRRLILLLSGVGVMMLVIAWPSVSLAATLSVSPSSGSYTIGQTITATVRVNTAGQPINAGEGTVTWTPTTLQFVSISANGSIFKYWPIDPVVRGTASAMFSGGLPSPGYTGSAGTILRLVFTAKAVGTATIGFSGGKVLANDGLGTDVYTGQGAATYTITAATKPTPAPPTPEVPNRPTPAVSSATYPDQATWYREADVKLAWTKPNGLTGVSYEVTAEQGTIPDDRIDTANFSTTVTLPSDGTWYFHLRGKYETGWSATQHYALHLDRTPPETFTPTVVQDRGPSDPTPVLTFSATDKTSGIARYTYSVDGGQPIDASSPTDIAGITAGEHTVVVTAIDLAGNIREATARFSITGYTAPTITSVSTPLLLLDPLVVRGTANLGDTISISVNGRVVGQVVAGPGDVAAAPGVTLRVPWSFTTDTFFRPGTYTITATTTSPDGQVSTATDPQTVRVTGQALSINGRPIATWSVVTPVAVLILSLIAAIVAVFSRLALAVWMMHRRFDHVEEEIEALRDVNQQQAINRQQLDTALVQIEEDLDDGKVRRRTTTRLRPKKHLR